MKNKRVREVAKEFGVSVNEIIDIVRTVSPNLWEIGPNSKIEAEIISAITKHISGEAVLEIHHHTMPNRFSKPDGVLSKVYNTEEIPKHLFIDNPHENQVIELLSNEDIFINRVLKSHEFNNVLFDSIFSDFEAFSICGGIDDAKARYISRQYFKGDYKDEELLLAHQIAMKALNKYGSNILSYLLTLPPLPFKSQMALKLFSELDNKRGKQKFPIIRILYKNRFGVPEKLTLSYYAKLDNNRNKIRYNNVIQIKNKASNNRIMTITRDGNIIPEKNAKEIIPIINLYIRFCQNPKEFIINYGFETGECSICGRELTDPESVRRGIGPICYSYVK